MRQGSVESAGYGEGFFDAVVSTGSFSQWDEPVRCLDEIWRILKPGREAWIFETYADCDREAVLAAVEKNLSGEGLVRRVLAAWLFRRQLGKTYRFAEMEAIVRRSRFAGSAQVERVTLAGVPAFARMLLTKQG